MRSSTVSERLFQRLYQTLSGYEHPTEVHGEDRTALMRRLNLIDDDVPARAKRADRQKGNYQDHKEWFCAKRYLRALAAADLLAYPLTVRKSQSPDFLLEWPNGSTTGLEVTEATTEAFQRELTATEGQPGPHFVGPDAGWAGDEVEQGVAALCMQAVAKKAHKIAHARNWHPATRHDLLLYNNGPFMGIHVEPFIACLNEQWRAQPVPGVPWTPWPKGPLGRISLLIGGGYEASATLLFDLVGTCKIILLS